MTLSEIIVEYRQKHNLSQRQFAVQCDLSNGYISLLEKNANPKTGKPVTPTLPVLRKLATGMHITLDELLTQTDDMSVDMSKNPATENGDGLDATRYGELSETNKAIVNSLIESLLAAQSDS